MLTLTGSAVAAVKRTIGDERLSNETCLRVRVEGGGCSGLTYSLSFEDRDSAGDRRIEQDGVVILVDPRSELYLAGTELDYTSGLNGHGFVFRNPNAKGTCGCGKSFAA